MYVARSGCSSILHLLSRIEGSGRRSPEASPLPEWSPEMVIHDPRVHGLRTLECCSGRVRRAAISSPDWWRFAVVRDPHARFLSAWTDKVFLRAPGTPQFLEDSVDVLTDDGCIDVTATFAGFVRRE